jgi:hypothetical protein
VCRGFHNLIRFNCAPLFASCRRHRVLTVTCLDACRCAAYLTLRPLYAYCCIVSGGLRRTDGNILRYHPHSRHRRSEINRRSKFYRWHMEIQHSSHSRLNDLIPPHSYGMACPVLHIVGVSLLPPRSGGGTDTVNTIIPRPPASHLRATWLMFSSTPW